MKTITYIKKKNYIDSIATGYKAIEFCLKTIEVSINNNFHNISNQNHNILPIKNIDIPNELSKKIKSIKIDWSKKGEKIDFMKEYNNNYKDIFLFILEKTFNIIDYHTSYCTAQYFHNIYSMLILLNDNRKKINIESYLRTLRAEFNQEELLFIYYYACIRNANNIKFKSLVEDTCLFHNLNNERLDHDPLHDKPFVLYGKSAFTH